MHCDRPPVFTKFMKFNNKRKALLCAAGDQVFSAVIRRDPSANACSSVGHGWLRSEIVNQVTPTLTCTHARRFAFPWQIVLKKADVRMMFCVLLVVLIAAPNNRRRSFFFVFRRQNAPQVATQRSPSTRFASRTLLSVYSHIFGFERFCSPQVWLWLVDFWLRALGRCRRSSTPNTSGTRLKVEKPATDPQRNCLDWRARQVWWIILARKSSLNYSWIF